MPIKLSTSYLELGQALARQTLPVPVAEPKLLLWNESLAQALALPFTQQSFIQQEDANILAEYFSGNILFNGSKPIAQAYAGHQFGHFNPQLGDGRAHLLGDITDNQGKQWDIQLKGSGVTQFSRQGDGRCALGPALREYIMSEAMFALGVPTTRCLAVVTTGEDVYRERPYAGAIVTRIATSHIRVGTFQYFAARQDIDSLKKLTQYAIKRHFPELVISKDTLVSTQILSFFQSVLAKQIPLVMSWLRVGFIHGVMNTDNTAISGETIDYGPCAMMNAYHSDTAFSSIDKYGRYAFGKQMSIIQWNMTRLAEALLPLVDNNEKNAIAKIEPLLAEFHANLEHEYLAMMAAKLGIGDLKPGDAKLINDLLGYMQSKSIDYTQMFTQLTSSLEDEHIANQLEAQLSKPLNGWLTRWYNRIAENKVAAYKLMVKNNPVVIPRNHHVEAILLSVQENGDIELLDEFLSVLRQPYTVLAQTHKYQDAPVDSDSNYHTFCGT